MVLSPMLVADPLPFRVTGLPSCEPSTLKVTVPVIAPDVGPVGATCAVKETLSPCDALGSDAVSEVVVGSSPTVKGLLAELAVSVGVAAVLAVIVDAPTGPATTIVVDATPLAPLTAVAVLPLSVKVTVAPETGWLVPISVTWAETVCVDPMAPDVAPVYDVELQSCGPTSSVTMLEAPPPLISIGQLPFTPDFCDPSAVVGAVKFTVYAPPVPVVVDFVMPVFGLMVDWSRVAVTVSPEAPELRLPLTGTVSPPQATPFVSPPIDSLMLSDGAGVDALASAMVVCSHVVVELEVQASPAGTPVRKLS